MKRTHPLHRSSICIDGVDTIHALFFDEIASTSMSRLHVIIDFVAQENVVAPIAAGDECQGTHHPDRSPREPD
jgi:hypothetical protein